MRLVRVAAEGCGNAERRGARYEPPKPHDPLVFFRAKSAVMDQEAAKVSARQAHGIGRLVNGPVAQELDGPRDLTGGRVQEQRIRLPSEDGVDEAPSARGPDEGIKRELLVAELVCWDLEDGGHSLGSQPQAERR